MNSEYNSKMNVEKYLMSLLYKQTAELQNLYSSPLENTQKYYLVNKEWLDNIKNSNNYKNIINNWDISYNNQSYFEFKNNLIKTLKINESTINNKLENISDNDNYLCPKEKVKISKKYVSYPKSGELIRQEYFSNTPGWNGNNNPLYEILIGCNTIILIDNEIKNTLFLCSLIKENNMDNLNFNIQVDGILVYINNDEDDDEIFEREIKKIKYYKGLEMYYKNRKLNPGKKGQQKIVDLEDDEIGYFYNLNEKCYNDKININKNIIENENKKIIDLSDVNTINEGTIKIDDNKNNINSRNDSNYGNNRNIGNNFSIMSDISDMQNKQCSFSSNFKSKINLADSNNSSNINNELNIYEHSTPYESQKLKNMVQVCDNNNKESNNEKSGINPIYKIIERNYKESKINLNQNFNNNIINNIENNIDFCNSVNEMNTFSNINQGNRPMINQKFMNQNNFNNMNQNNFNNMNQNNFNNMNQNNFNDVNNNINFINRYNLNNNMNQAQLNNNNQNFNDYNQNNNINRYNNRNMNMNMNINNINYNMNNLNNNNIQNNPNCFPSNMNNKIDFSNNRMNLNMINGNFSNNNMQNRINNFNNNINNNINGGINAFNMINSNDYMNNNNMNNLNSNMNNNMNNLNNNMNNNMNNLNSNMNNNLNNLNSNMNNNLNNLNSNMNNCNNMANFSNKDNNPNMNMDDNINVKNNRKNNSIRQSLIKSIWVD